MDKILKTKPFGNTGLNLSPLGFGTVKIGRNQNVKNACADGFDLPSDKQVETLLELCLELGINVIDTAPAYGISEERLGKLLGSHREKFNLFSKTGEIFQNGESVYDFSYEGTMKSVEKSLKLLKVDVLEGVQVHANHAELQVLEEGECVRALQELKRRGDIQTFGWSSMSLEGGLKALDVCDTVMVSINPLYTNEMEVIEKAAKIGKGVFLKKALLQGHLSQVEGDAVASCMNFAANLAGDVCVVAGTLKESHLRANAQAVALAFGAL